MGAALLRFASSEDRAGGFSGRAALLSAALALGFCLFGWRAVQTLTQDNASASHASAEEARLASLIEPVAGASRVKTSIRRHEDGKQTILVLIDRSPDGAGRIASRIENLVESAADYSPARGDILRIEQFEFAGGAAARPSSAALLELAGLAALCGLIATLLVSGRREAASRAASEHAARPAARMARPVPADIIDMPASGAISRAGEAAASDPKAAAGVLRRWLNGKDDAA